MSKLAVTSMNFPLSFSSHRQYSHQGMGYNHKPRIRRTCVSVRSDRVFSLYFLAVERNHVAGQSPAQAVEREERFVVSPAPPAQSMGSIGHTAW